MIGFSEFRRGVKDLPNVEKFDLESRDESRGGSSPSARTSRAVSPEPGRICRERRCILVRKMGREE